MKGDGRDGVSRMEMGHDLGMDHLFDIMYYNGKMSNSDTL